MSDFLKCDCPHCGQSIEYPAEGTRETVPCPTCQKPATLTTAEQPQDNGDAQRKKEQDDWIALHERLRERRIQSGIPLSEESTLPKAGEPQRINSQEDISLPTDQPIFWEHRATRSRLALLTEETIRKTNQKGETPVHRAAKTGRINEIPKHLLSLELFMARDNSFGRATPLHTAAEYGHLDQVPKEFLTRETMTASTEYEKKESKTGSTPPRTETPLHVAARCGNADQIPKEFLTPEFLSIEASGYRLTVLHNLAYSNRLDVVPQIYANSEMWNLRNSQGQTPHDVIESKKKREIYVAKVRSEPATEKQKEKLRWFDYALKAGMTKGEASDAIDECVRKYPEKDREYYNRPATEEQMAQLREYAKTDKDVVMGFEELAEEGSVLTYGEAKDWLWQCMTDAQKREMEEYDAYAESEDGQIDEELDHVNFYYGSTWREVTREEVVSAWSLVKSRTSKRPTKDELFAALEELFSDFKPIDSELGILTTFCIHCREPLKNRPPKDDNITFAPEDIIHITIRCPHCGKDTSTYSTKQWGDRYFITK